MNFIWAVIFITFGSFGLAATLNPDTWVLPGLTAVGATWSVVILSIGLFLIISAARD